MDEAGEEGIATGTLLVIIRVGISRDFIENVCISPSQIGVTIHPRLVETTACAVAILLGRIFSTKQFRKYPQLIPKKDQIRMTIIKDLFFSLGSEIIIILL